MDVDPLISLASAIYSAPGTVALLVGSGISRSAEVPSGWEVARDLIGQVALLQDGERPDDPERWLAERDGGTPDYSVITKALAPTAADRRNLLEHYFEPTPDERERGAKTPTRAHRAIAELVAGGYIRVIVTPNFDRLLEVALVDAGVQPVVISSAAAAEGAIPLAHSRCTVIKPNGDYLDPDLKNTIEELGSYPPEIEKLLDRVFDEYGLAICGWSGEWDQALRAALLRCPTRRYGTYWAHVSPPGDRGAQIIAQRAATDIPIGNADEFFESLAGKVSALEDAMSAPPISIALAVAEAKRYLPDPVHDIRLHDIFMAEVSRFLALPIPSMNDQPTVEAVRDRMDQYERAAATLVPLAMTCAYFANREAHFELLTEVVRRLAGRKREHSGYDIWISLELYPALLALYGIGLGSLARQRVAPLAKVLSGVEVPHPNGAESAIVALASFRVLDGERIKARPEYDRRKTPVSDYLCDRLREPLSLAIGVDAYDDLFDGLEYLLGVVCTWKYGRGPIGRVWRRDRVSEPQLIEPAGLLNAGLFDGSDETLAEAKATYDAFISQSGLRW